MTTGLPAIKCPTELKLGQLLEHATNGLDSLLTLSIGLEYEL